MGKYIVYFALLVTSIYMVTDSLAHRGGLDQYGSHWNRSTNTYHNHRDPSEMELGSNGKWRLSCEAGSRSKDCKCTVLSWEAPTHREDGTPIPPGWIHQYIVTMTTNQGATSHVLIPGDQLQADCHALGLPLGRQDLDYHLRAVDNGGLISKPSAVVHD